MAEAFGLAAGILQVVDFGRQFVLTARRLYLSGAEGLDSLSDLQLSAANLRNVLNVLIHHSQDDAGNMSDIDNSTLIKECAGTLSEMLEVLDKIQIPAKGMKREAVVAAFKTLWKKEKINALQDRLDKFNKQLTLNLIISLRTHATTSIQNQHQILERLAQLTGNKNPINHDTSLLNNGFGSVVIDYLTEPLQESSRDAGKVYLRQELVKAVYERERDGDASSKIHIFDKNRERLNEVFLAHLYYPGHRDRELRIPEAHQKTFRWIFDDPKDNGAHWSSFKSWLESDDQVYWITGKAGAGKSTLMKFVTQPDKASVEGSHQEPRCATYLNNRSGEKPYVLSSFYFWAAGSPMQKRVHGLFLTVLSQLLRAYPEAIPHASPSTWEALSLFDESPRAFTPDEVAAMFRRTIIHIDSLATPVLFIDGLDEVDGDHQGLISLLHDIVSNSSTKLCVASRPWVEFEKAFEFKPSLRLEDLTYSDIKNYVRSRFLSDESFNSLARRDPGFSATLIEDVVVKASGVFLWVQLVVSSLLTGIRFGDRIKDLKERLDLLPPDLEKLYEGILDSFDPFYRRHAAEYFAIIRSCPEPPRALLLSFADEEDPVAFALEMENNAMSTVEISHRVNDMRLRVNSRCKGLLELDRPNQRIDYIDSKDAQRKLEKIPDDAHLKLLAANLALFKALRFQEPGAYNSIMEIYMYHAARVRSEHAVDVIKLMDAFFRTTVSKAIVIPAPSEVRDHPWVMTLANRFLCQAAKFGVYRYVGVKSKDNCLILDEDNEIGRSRIARRLVKLVSKLSQPGGMDYPLLLLPIETIKPWDDFTLKTVEAILNKGGNPNYTFDFHYCARVKSPTIWKVVLARVICAFAHKSVYTGDRDVLGKICRLMINHGAVINRLVIDDALEILADNIVVRKGTILWKYRSDHWYNIENAGEIKRVVFDALKRLKVDRTCLVIEMEQEYALDASRNEYQM